MAGAMPGYVDPPSIGLAEAHVQAYCEDEEWLDFMNFRKNAREAPEAQRAPPPFSRNFRGWWESRTQAENDTYNPRAYHPFCAKDDAELENVLAAQELETNFGDQAEYPSHDVPLEHRTSPWD